MKKRFFLFMFFAMAFAFFILSSLSAVTDGNSTMETELTGIISDLLSGKTTDTPNALSTLEEKDLPLALTACEALQHKALHQDIKLSPEAVEAFKGSLQKRLETSQTVSFKQTPTCVQKIPAREIIIEGKHLTVPQHYLAPERFAITAFSPTGEAGTLFPDIKVQFTGGKVPITAKIILNGKEIPAKAVKNSFLYRPKLQADSIMKIGIHKVETIFTDTSGAMASASWSFTIGLAELPLKEIPPDAVLSGSFITTVSKVLPDSPFKGSIQIVTYETSAGERIFEYVVFGESNDKPLVKTTSLAMVRKFLRVQNKNWWLNIKPETPYAFVGNTIPLSYDYGGYGPVVSVLWEITDASGTQSFQTPTVSWVIKGNTTKVVVNLAVKASSDENSSTIQIYNSKKIEAITPNRYIYTKRNFNLSNTGTGTIFLDGDRTIRPPYAGQTFGLIEGNTIPYLGGNIFVTRSQWKGVASGKVTIENPLATGTNLIFQEPGQIEVFHDLSLKYTFIGNSGQEVYEKEFPADESGLLGVYPYQANVEFASWPSGIILGTSRGVVFNSLDLEINGIKRRVNSQNGYVFPVDPPILLARSTMFPQSLPLMAEGGYVFALSKTPSGLTQMPFKDLVCTVSYAKPEDAINGEIAFRPYFAVFQVHDDKMKGEVIPWPTFYQYFRPLNDWLSIKAFSSPVELVQAEFDPQNPETEEGKNVDFKTSIVPKPGLGEGKITADGGVLNLLDGYETQQVTEFAWSAFLPPSQTPVAQGSTMNFSFEPKNGTGTYAINATTLLKVKEKNTGGVADVTGVGSTTILVKPGFKITSPVASFSYPLGVTVLVSVSLPSTEWSKITWLLNDKPWKPETTEPPAHLTLENSGKTTLKAIYKPSENVEQTDEIAFFVKPVSLKIAPDRRVIPFVQAKTTHNLNLHVELNGKEVHELDKEVAWDDNGQKASVEKIEWSAVTKPDMTDPISFNEKDPFTAVAAFDKEGALTALATVTIKVTNSPKIKKQNPQTFAISSGRADLWSIKTPSSYELKGHFPQLALAEAGRTFIATEARFVISNTSYVWSPGGLSPKMVLSPALSGVPNLESQTVDFTWKASDGESSKKNSFIVSCNSTVPNRRCCIHDYHPLSAIRTL